MRPRSQPPSTTSGIFFSYSRPSRAPPPPHFLSTALDYLLHTPTRIYSRSQTLRARENERERERERAGRGFMNTGVFALAVHRRRYARNRYAPARAGRYTPCLRELYMLPRARAKTFSTAYARARVYIYIYIYVYMKYVHASINLRASGRAHIYCRGVWPRYICKFQVTARRSPKWRSLSG